MKFRETPLPGAYVIELQPIQDERGSFVRIFCAEEMRKRGLVADYSQANQSQCSRRGVLRGLHYQIAPFAEAKLVRCIKGAVFDVMVDVRRGSSTFLSWFGCVLTDANRLMAYVPAGFAHGYQALSDDCVVSYQSSVRYVPELEKRVRWDEPRVGITWPIKEAILSAKDLMTPPLGSEFYGVDA